MWLALSIINDVNETILLMKKHTSRHNGMGINFDAHKHGIHGSINMVKKLWK